MNTPQKKLIDIETIEKYFRIEEDGAVWSLRKNKYLKPSINTAGYLFVATAVPPERLSEGYGYAASYAVHRLVAVKYLGQCPYGMETSHKDGDKFNNHYTNLEYITHSENILKSFREHHRPPPMKGKNRNPFSDDTKALMSDAKKKKVLLSCGGKEITYPSIEEASQSLHTYRKKIQRAIYDNIPISDPIQGIFNAKLSFL